MKLKNKEIMFNINDRVKIVCGCQMCRGEALTGKTAIIIAVRNRQDGAFPLYNIKLLSNGKEYTGFTKTELIIVKSLNRNNANK